MSSHLSFDRLPLCLPNRSRQLVDSLRSDQDAFVVREVQLYALMAAAIESPALSKRIADSPAESSSNSRMLILASYFVIRHVGSRIESLQLLPFYISAYFVQRLHSLKTFMRPFVFTIRPDKAQGYVPSLLFCLIFLPH